MAYGDLSMDAPFKPNKGLEGGACNRQSCQAEPANWYNHGSLAWYCGDCRRAIQFDSFNFQDWERNYEPRLKHPMFETRGMMDARQAEFVQPLDERYHDLDKIVEIYGSPTGRTQPDHVGQLVFGEKSVRAYQGEPVIVDEYGDMAQLEERVLGSIFSDLMAPPYYRYHRQKKAPSSLPARVMMGMGVRLLTGDSPKPMTKRKLRRIKGRGRG